MVQRIDGGRCSGCFAVGSTARITFAPSGDTISGKVTLADGRTTPYASTLKTDGSGIYNVKVGADGSYEGTTVGTRS